MSEPRSFRFGPGSLESIHLDMRETPHEAASPRSEVTGRVSGSYRVCSGAGSEHSVEIGEALTVDPEHPTEFDEQLARAWKKGDADAAAEASHQAIEWALESWADPCPRVRRGV